MRDYSLQREEIETIKPRTITVNLSDDFRTVGELHRGFSRRNIFQWK